MKFFLPHSRRSGFTLLELIISFGVMAIVVFGAASIYVTSIRANSSSVQRFIAYSLAQEGLEGVRNIRDSYFRQSLSWNGSDTVAQLVDAKFLPGQYRIYRKMSSQIVPLMSADDASLVKNASPWVFQVCTEKDCDQLYQIHDGGVPYYIHQGNVALQGATETMYRRKIVLSFLKNDGSASETVTDRMQVVAHIDWKDRGIDKSLELTTELTNWKQRPF